jgi:hypothetical protein
MSRSGRPPKIGDGDAVCLVEIVKSDPLATLGEVRREFKRRAGIDAHTQTISTALRQRGIRRVPNRDVACSQGQAVKPAALQSPPNPRPENRKITAFSARSDRRPESSSVRPGAAAPKMVL